MTAPARPFLAGLATGILLATAARALLSTLFFLSLQTLRLNGTAAWTLVLLAPVLAPLVPRARWPLLVAGAATAALPLARFTEAYVPVGALAVAAGLVALARLPRAGRTGALAGVALGGVLLLVGRSHDPMLTLPGGAAALALGLLGAWALRGAEAGPEPDGARARPSPRLVAGAAWACLLVAELAFLASPYALAQRTGVPPWAAAPAAVGGVLAGVALPWRHRAWPPALGALGLAGLGALEGAAAAGAIVLLQAGLGAAAARLPPPHGATLGIVLAPLAFGVLYFGQPLGEAEWTLLVPLLCAVPLLAAPLASSAPRPGAHAPSPPPRVAAPLLLAALLAVPLAALAAPAAPVAPHEGDAFTVVNWNVRQGFGNRGALDPALYADALRRLAPDVLVLQESDTARFSSGGLDVVGYLEHELGLRAVARGPGIAILARFPLAPGEEAPPPEGWSVQAPLDVHGRTVWVQGVHLARNREERALQVEEILRDARARPGPRVLAGDLNSCAAATCFGGRPSDGVHDALAAEYADAWLVAHEPDDDPAGHTHPSWDPRRRIDVVMVRGLDALEAGPVRDDLTPLGSDHLPVRARVRAPWAGGAGGAGA